MHAVKKPLNRHAHTSERASVAAEEVRARATEREREQERARFEAEVLSVLALLVEQVLTLLALLVQQYRY